MGHDRNRTMRLPRVLAFALAATLATGIPVLAAASTDDAGGGGDAGIACYHAALEGGHDAYPCDLAVQVATDGAPAPTLAAALANRALILARDGRLEPALADLDAALAQTPGNPALHGNRGNLLLRLGRPVDALAAYDRAVELAPNDPRGYYNRAFGYRAVGEPLRAEQDVQAARSLLQRRLVPFTDPGTPAPDGYPGR